MVEWRGEKQSERRERRERGEKRGRRKRDRERDKRGKRETQRELYLPRTYPAKQLTSSKQDPPAHLATNLSMIGSP